MGKININTLDEFEDDYEVYEKFTKSNRKTTDYEENFLQSQGKSVGGRTVDSYIGRQKKARN
jgi:hypothetical protein